MEATNYTPINSIKDFELIISKEEISICYFSHDACNVCKVLKPKIAEMVSEKFPKIKLYYINTEHQAEIAAQSSVFTVPVMLTFFGGKEYIRKARNFGLMELEDELSRLYQNIHF